MSESAATQIDNQIVDEMQDIVSACALQQVQHPWSLSHSLWAEQVPFEGCGINMCYPRPTHLLCDIIVNLTRQGLLLIYLPIAEHPGELVMLNKFWSVSHLDVWHPPSSLFPHLVTAHAKPSAVMEAAFTFFLSAEGTCSLCWELLALACDLPMSPDSSSWKHLLCASICSDS